MLNKKGFESKIRIVRYNLNSLLIGSFILAILTGFFYIFFFSSIINSFLGFLSAFFIFVLIRLNRKEKNHLIVTRILIIFLDFVLLPLAWLTTYGSKGPMIFYSTIFIIISSLLLTSWKENIFLAFIVLEVSLLWVFEPNLSSLIIFLSGNYKVEENLLLHYLLACLILCTIMISNNKNTKSVESSLNKLSMIDPLTKLYNRRYLMKSLNSLHNEYIRTSNKYIVIILDIDNLKKLNDTYGHVIGDRVLKTMGNIILSNTRSYDISVRYGGDEFVIVLPNAEIKDKDNVISRIEDAFNLYSIEYKNIQLGLSYGFSDNNMLSVHEIIHEADQNLYKMKVKKKTKITPSIQIAS